MKNQVEAFNLTPTWIRMLPHILALYETGSPTRRDTARKKLYRMAALADKYVASQQAE